jgi:NADH-quinone oxidoreductase subunit C
MTDIANLFEKLNTRFNGRLEQPEGGKAIFTSRENLIELLKALKEEFGFEGLADLTAVDYTDHYEVVYHLHNASAELIAVKVKLPEDDCRVPSVVSLWTAADSQEREAYDLLGITFEGHGNLTRILCPDDFEGHPLRKSFKLKEADRFQESIVKGGRLNGITGR